VNQERELTQGKLAPFYAEMPRLLQHWSALEKIQVPNSVPVILPNRLGIPEN